MTVYDLRANQRIVQDSPPSPESYLQFDMLLQYLDSIAYYNENDDVTNLEDAISTMRSYIKGAQRQAERGTEVLAEAQFGGDAT